MRSVVLLVAFVGCNQTTETRAVPSKLELRPAPVEFEDAAGVIRTELDNARRDGRQLVVYVGAVWCEPCTRFHDAAASGQLDDQFGSLRLLEFDADRDEAALARAGYASEMIPLFALPNADGTASDRRIQGSVKGDGAVANLAPRLLKLLGP